MNFARGTSVTSRRSTRRQVRADFGQSSLLRRRPAALGWGSLLDRVELHKREIVSKHSRELICPGLREVPLRLNDEEARRHADLETLSFSIEPLFGQVAGRTGCFNSLRVHLDIPSRGPDLLNHAGL